MSTESITNFAEQEAAAMKKNKEMFMALWVEYVKGRRGDKAVLRYLEYTGFSRPQRPRSTTGLFLAACATTASTLRLKCWGCWNSTNLKMRICAPAL